VDGGFRLSGVVSDKIVVAAVFDGRTWRRIG
jgi:hypothetical protein